MTTLGAVCLPQVPPDLLRNVATAAMDTAMLDSLFPGRVSIGVGHGLQSWMRQNGVAAESPMTLLREYLMALEWPPTAAPPVLAGAIGPRTLRLSGECADGTVLVAGRDAARAAADVRGLAAAGADSVVLQPAPEQADLERFERFIRFAAEQVRPLLP